MKIIFKFLVIVLMSIITSGAYAQAPKMQDVAKLSSNDVTRIKRFLSTATEFNVEDSVMVIKLIEEGNFPIKGIVCENEEFIPLSQAGDDWQAYISYDLSCFWLSYVISRKEKLVGRLDIRVE